MRSVLITGTSSGIGLATVVVLASRGWRVFATMRNPNKKNPLEQALRAVGAQVNVDIEELDVTSQASIQAATASILARTGNTLDAVVHNASGARNRLNLQLRLQQQGGTGQLPPLRPRPLLSITRQPPYVTAWRTRPRLAHQHLLLRHKMLRSAPSARDTTGRFRYTKR